MTKKIDEMLRSGDPEIRLLGLETCRVDNPMLWAALMGFTGPKISSKIIEEIFTDSQVFVGAKVRYKGMDNCPVMVVSSVNVQQMGNVASSMVNNLNSGGRTEPGYCLHITAKYYNKSTQSFNQTTDRVECFEIIN